jgi:hypothetical protein
LVNNKETLWLSEKHYKGSEFLVPDFMKSWLIHFETLISSLAMQTQMSGSRTVVPSMSTSAPMWMISWVLLGPQAFFDDLTKDPYNYKLSGVKDPKYHRGGVFSRDDDGTLTWGSRKYSEKILADYEIIFHEQPPKKSSPMEKGDSPERDQSKELGADSVSLHQSLIGVLQWAVTLGIFDILVAVMSILRQDQSSPVELCCALRLGFFVLVAKWRTDQVMTQSVSAVNIK